MTEFTPRPGLVLASGSPRRAELLTGAGLPFAVRVPVVVEHDLEDASRFGGPAGLVLANATLKAEAARAVAPDADCILAADTVVALENRVLHKPTDRADAVRMLASLAGREHQVLTGVVLVGGRVPHGRDAWTSTSTVRFHPASRERIEAYIDAANPLDKAGAYGIQDPASRSLVAGFEGSFSNIVGLPLEDLLLRLAACGIHPV
ncbi:MAG: Maf family protein [Opitutales bacterium]